MDARSVIQRIVAIFVIIVGALVSPAFAGPVTINYGGDYDLPIPAIDDPGSEYGIGQMDDAIIVVPDSFLIQNVDVTVGLTHGAFFDLEIKLQSPAGTEVILNPAGNSAFLVKEEGGGVSPVGGTVNWLFDDEADVSIEQAFDPFIGPYQPVELLSIFDGEDIFGEWRLHIRDCWRAHDGELDSFAITFTEIPEPSTSMILVFATYLAALKKPGREF